MRYHTLTYSGVLMLYSTNLIKITTCGIRNRKTTPRLLKIPFRFIAQINFSCQPDEPQAYHQQNRQCLWSTSCWTVTHVYCLTLCFVRNNTSTSTTTATAAATTAATTTTITTTTDAITTYNTSSTTTTSWFKSWHYVYLSVAIAYFAVLWVCLYCLKGTHVT